MKRGDLGRNTYGSKRVRELWSSSEIVFIEYTKHVLFILIIFLKNKKIS